LAIVGAGVMGTTHARVASTMPDVDIVAVIDPDPDRGRELADQAGARYLPEVSLLDDPVDAAVVAAPSAAHAPIGVELLSRGVDVLVEKPIAENVESARRLVDAAARHDRVLMVGHIERFNPAILVLDEVLTEVLYMDMARIGPFSPRVADDVILDLMIHDLDLALVFAGSPASAVYSVARSVHSPTEDIANALLRFESGMTASVAAHRAGQSKIRRMTITQEDSFVRVDLVRQEVLIERRYQGEFTSKTGRVYRQTGVTEVPFLEKRGEPLALEVAHFLDCVRTRETPRVTGQQGLAALDLALRVRECGQPPTQTPAGSTAAAMPGASSRISSSSRGASSSVTASRA
jgi:predicted dehydrogenase